MTTFNGVTVISRGNRPSPIIPAKLDFLNYVAGAPANPFQVCSVHIFPNTQFGSADGYVNRTPGSADFGLVSSTATDMLFHNYKRNLVGDRTGFDANLSAMAFESSYMGDLRYSSSSIFWVNPGHFSVILQPSGSYFAASAPANNWTKTYTNNTSAVGEYIDIWTVVQVEGSRAQIYVNQFGMQTANTFATTEPLEVTTTNKLTQRYVELGSKKRLQIKTEIVVDNEPMKQSLRNLIETGSLISNPEISIVKLNESPALTSRVDITGNQETDKGGFTSVGVDLDREGTISYVWDTTNIQPFYESDMLGGGPGVYEITVRYNVVDETILSSRFKLIVR